MTTDNRTNEPNQNETKSGQEFCFTEAQVEAAAKAMWDLRKLQSDPEWGELEYGVKQEYRKDARAALVAAAGAAPVLPSSTVDEDALAEVIREALRDDRLRVAYGAPVNKPQHVVVARAVAEWLKEQGL